MPRWLAYLPLMVILLGIGGLAMYLPAAHALTLRDHNLARIFFYSGTLTLALAAVLGLTTAGRPAAPGTARQARSHLLTMLGTMVLLPLVLAVPFNEAVPDTGFFNAWWEMVSAITTTGATLYEPDRLAPSLHLWRAEIGWLGGLFMLITATAVLAPMRIGGFEILSAAPATGSIRSPRAGAQLHRRHVVGGHAPEHVMVFSAESVDASAMLLRHARIIAPIYAGITLALWIALLLAGDSSLVALCHAMSTISTSGISPQVGGDGGPVAGPVGAAGFWAELAVFAVMLMAVSRRFWPSTGELRATERMRDDPEIRLAGLIVALVPLVLFLRHFLDRLALSRVQDETIWQVIGEAFQVIWGATFTALSFLTTTGFESTSWALVRDWSGLHAPSLILSGLAIFGGGVATTAGGVKLLRIYALMRHGEREMQKMTHPSSIGGGGRVARRLRREGAFLAFIFFMLFAMSIAIIMALTAITQVPFIESMVLSIAALSNTGPLPVVAQTFGASWADVPFWSKPVLAMGMVLGRLETLAILALFNRELWRG